MARSTYIYTVERRYRAGWEVVAAFTVKHEMVSYVQASILAGKLSAEWGLRIVRLLDGGHGTREDITAQFTWATS